MTFASRLTGHVTRVQERSGTWADKQSGELRPWRMALVDVFLPGGAATTATVMYEDGRAAVDIPEPGKSIDWLVETGQRTRNGTSMLTMTVVSAWDAQPNIIGLLLAGQGVDTGNGGPRPVPAPAVKAS